MGFNFPNSPIIGSTFAAGGITYTWNGTTWTSSGGAPIIISDAAPAPATTNPGTLWWESDSGMMFVCYDDGSSRQWVQVIGAAGKDGKDAVKTALSRNLLVNPSFQHAQEWGHNTSLATSGQYHADQWCCTFSGPACSFAAETQAVGPNYQRMWAGAVLASPAATNYAAFSQPIEGIRLAPLRWGTANAIPAVLRFRARALSGLALPFTASVAIRNAAPNRSYLANFVLTSTSYQEFTVPIPPDTTGTWATDNTLGMGLVFCTMCGSTYLGTPGAWLAGNFLAGTGVSNMFATSSTGIDITEVGLYLDPDNTGNAPPYQTPEYFAELDACKRYWKMNDDSLGTHPAVNTTFRTIKPMSPIMRTNPVLALNNGTQLVHVWSVAYLNGSAIALNNCTNTLQDISLTTAAASILGLFGSLSASKVSMNARM